MTGSERLARAVLLFFRGGHPSENDRAVWEVMTGRSAMTAATLCDFAREVLSDERIRSQGLPRREGMSLLLWETTGRLAGVVLSMGVFFVSALMAAHGSYSPFIYYRF